MGGSPSVWRGGRGARGVSKVTYQGNKDNKCGLTGGQKLVKSRTLWMLTGGHSWVFGKYLVLFSSLSSKIFFPQSSNPFTFISIDNLPYHKFTNILINKNIKVQWSLYYFSEFQNTSGIVFATCWPCSPQVEFENFEIWECHPKPSSPYLSQYLIILCHCIFPG